MNILITGANRGLGLTLSQEAVQAGHTVLATYRTEPGEGLDQLQKKHPDRLYLTRLEVASQDSVDACAALAADKLKVVDVLVNNAGILRGRGQTIDQLDLDDVAACMDVNAYGPLRVTQAILPVLRKSQRGCIANISSDAGSIAKSGPDDYAYGLSKVVLNKASESLRKHLQPENIKVLAIHPGWMRTDMGGPEAHEDPADSARKILGLIDGSRKTPDDTSFIDFEGERMPF